MFSLTFNRIGSCVSSQQFLGLAGSKASSVRSICTIPDVKVLVPAGRFDLVISRTSMKLQGKSNDFTIEFTNMTRFVNPMNFIDFY